MRERPRALARRRGLCAQLGNGLLHALLVFPHLGDVRLLGGVEHERLQVVQVHKPLTVLTMYLDQILRSRSRLQLIRRASVLTGT